MRCRAAPFWPDRDALARLTMLKLAPRPPPHAFPEGQCRLFQKPAVSIDFGIHPCGFREDCPMDRFDAMTVFVRVVEAGSLSAAARLVPMSLTSVSRQISDLEARLGTQLLRRTTRRLALTDEG